MSLKIFDSKSDITWQHEYDDIYPRVCRKHQMFPKIKGKLSDSTEYRDEFIVLKQTSATFDVRFVSPYGNGVFQRIVVNKDGSIVALKN